MSGLELSRNSKIPPDPWKVDHGGAWQIGYTCHMAAIHWALMTLGDGQMEANRIVSAFAKAVCPACNGGGGHNAVRSDIYAARFCAGAQRIPDRGSLHDMVDVGDVLITENPVRPQHTMILRQKRGDQHITIRGFNNQGTLGTGVRDRYDPLSHNITQGKYWHDAANGLFGRSGVHLYVVKHDRFMAAANRLRITLGQHRRGSRWN